MVKTLNKFLALSAVYIFRPKGRKDPCLYGLLSGR